VTDIRCFARLEEAFQHTGVFVENGFDVRSPSLYYSPLQRSLLVGMQQASFDKGRH
jgi:hypothetical protein